MRGPGEAAYSPNPDIESVELSGTPFYAQARYQCGPAALAMVLNQAGVPVTPDELVSRVYIPGRNGSIQSEMIAASRQAGTLAVQLDPDIRILQQTLLESKPVLVFQNLGFRKFPVWHYAVLIGYDGTSKEYILRSGKTRRKVMSAKQFYSSWEKGESWAVVVLKPGEIISTVSEQAYLASLADIEQLKLFDSALKGYQAATVRWSNSEFSWLGLGNVYYSMGSLEASEAAFRRAIDINRSSAVAYNNLATVLLEKGCADAALDTIDTALGVAGSSQNHLAAVESTREEILAAIESGSARNTACGS